MTANQDQIACWNGPAGDNWVRFQEAMDAGLSEASDAVLALAAPRPGEKVLDVGCGSGSTSRALAAAVGPSGRVTAADISRPLLQSARSHPNPPNLEFVEADASCHPFAQDHDLLFSRFGTMFFDAPVAALAHLRGTLKDGGRMAFVCWRPAPENEWVTLPLGVAKEIVPPQPATDPHAPGPFAFSDPARLNNILTEAGFHDIAITPFDGRMNFGTSPAEAAYQMVNLGPTARLLQDADDETRKKVSDAITQRLIDYQTGNEPIRVRIACWLVCARR